MTPEAPQPVKLLAAVLWADASALGQALGRLEGLWGPIDVRGPPRAFDATRYYEPEMGPGLARTIIAFARLDSPEVLVARKLESAAIEAELRGPSGRRVNIDVGYLDVHKVVLGSLKHGPQKIWLGRGVWADIVCRYSRGAFHPFEWTFPDFRDGRYDEELLRIREAYKSALRMY